MKTVADRIIEFNRKVEFRGSLPEGISIMNPFRGGDEYIFGISSAFYRKYYADNNPRRLILGINPGRFGAGCTGIPFTDTKRLTGECSIAYAGRQTHEPSSVFIYEVIRAYGGPERFYGDYYINSVCPLGFTHKGENGREKNYNYYDRADLTPAVTDFIIWNISEQIAMGVRTDVCFCLGTGKNEKFLRALNDRYGFFGEIVALEHPRFIMQYKSASRDEYVSKYLELLNIENENEFPEKIW
jgi:hypothetical protein